MLQNFDELILNKYSSTRGGRRRHRRKTRKHKRSNKSRTRRHR